MDGELIIRGDYVSDARYLTLPALNIIALISFAVISTWGVSSYKFDVDTKISEVKVSLARMENELRSHTDELKSRMNDTWGKTDMYIWCKEVEVANKEFKCPPMAGVKF